LRPFLFAQACAARSRTCSRSSKGTKERPGVGPAAEFAEPGTLSSTAPTDFPLSRTAAREASSYRRPVLGAKSTLTELDPSFKAGAARISRNLRHVQPGGSCGVTETRAASFPFDAILVRHAAAGGAGVRPLIGITTYATDASWGVWSLPAALIPL